MIRLRSRNEKDKRRRMFTTECVNWNTISNRCVHSAHPSHLLIVLRWIIHISKKEVVLFSPYLPEFHRSRMHCSGKDNWFRGVDAYPSHVLIVLRWIIHIYKKRSGFIFTFSPEILPNRSRMHCSIKKFLLEGQFTLFLKLPWKNTIVWWLTFFLNLPWRNAIFSCGRTFK